MSSWCTLCGLSWFASHVSMCWMLRSCNPSWFVCNIFVCRRSTTCAFICPKRIPIEGVMPLFPRHCNLPRADFSTCISDVWDIAPPVGLQLYRSWMRWTEDLMEILNIQLSCIVNLWTCAQNWWGLATSVLETWRCWWWCSKFWAQFPSSSFEFHVLHG